MARRSRSRSAVFPRTDRSSHTRPPRERSGPGSLVAFPSIDADVERADRVADLEPVDHFHPGCDRAEVVVHAVAREKRRISQRDEELRAANAGRARGHAGRAALPVRGVGLIGELVGRSAGAVAERIAAWTTNPGTTR